MVDQGVFGPGTYCDTQAHAGVIVDMGGRSQGQISIWGGGMQNQSSIWGGQPAYTAASGGVSAGGVSSGGYVNGQTSGCGCGDGDDGNCACHGSYKYPVPSQYNYFWPGIYGQQTMPQYVSPWRYPDLNPIPEHWKIDPYEDKSPYSGYRY